MTSPKWILSAAILAMSAMPAFADTQTEEYVRTNANEVLASLNEPGLNGAERRAKFQGYMDEFTNLDAVAKFVIGSWRQRFSQEWLGQMPRLDTRASSHDQRMLYRVTKFPYVAVPRPRANLIGHGAGERVLRVFGRGSELGCQQDRVILAVPQWR